MPARRPRCQHSPESAEISLRRRPSPPTYALTWAPRDTGRRSSAATPRPYGEGPETHRTAGRVAGSNGVSALAEPAESLVGSVVVDPEQPGDPGDRYASLAKLKSLRGHGLIDRRDDSVAKLNNQRQSGRGSRPLRSRPRSRRRPGRGTATRRSSTPTAGQLGLTWFLETTRGSSREPTARPEPNQNPGVRTVAIEVAPSSWAGSVVRQISLVSRPRRRRPKCPRPDPAVLLDAPTQQHLSRTIGTGH